MLTDNKQKIGLKSIMDIVQYYVLISTTLVNFLGIKR